MVANRKIAAIIAVVLVLFSVFSFFFVADKISDQETFSGTSQELNEHEGKVARLAVASIGVAAALDLVPGEAGNSISDSLVELGEYFVVILAAIYLEKLLLVMGGVIAFKILIPIGCLLIAICLFYNSQILLKISFKLITLGLVLVILVPTSVWISQTFEDRILGDDTQKQLNEIAEEYGSSDYDEATAEEEESSGIFDRFTSAVSEGWDKVTAAFSGGVGKAKAYFNSLLKGISVFIVSTCIVPIITFLLLYLVINMLFGVTINTGVVNKKRSSLTNAVKKKMLKTEAVAELPQDEQGE